MSEYDHRKIEARWQRAWEEEGSFRASAPDDDGGETFYCLEMLPYPSGRLHMGHVRNYAIGDVVARFHKARGAAVLHPIGWDALGLPAENAAIDRGTHPREWTLQNIDHMRDQLRSCGFSYDWSREFATCEPAYYRWNQWFFLKMLERDLAYRKERSVNWCPSCATVLANEQVVGGQCWRCDSAVDERIMPQWFLRITRYAQELLDGLEELEAWPEKVRTMQRHWIGRSEGTRVSFPLAGQAPKEGEATVEVFTTRVDTIYGCTFVVVAPDHPLLQEVELPPGKGEELEAFARKAAAERASSRGEPAEKAGVRTGLKARNPYNGEEVPVLAGNFIVKDYGTGAVMAVPAHDQRDFEFARRYDLPVRPVIVPESGASPPSPEEMTEASTEDGWLVDSGPFTGHASAEARAAMTEHAESEGFGRAEVDYRLKDWGISRQRYWGTPIPIIHCQGCGPVPVPEADLPVELPPEAPLDGEGTPLARVEEWVRVDCPSCGAEARRETDTMDTFVDSSWYLYRYCDPDNHRAPFDPEKARPWFPVDLYIGGIEHATMHLVYFRFWTRMMRDLGLVEIDEPVRRLLTQGMVCMETRRCPEHGWIYPSEEEDGRCVRCGKPVEMGRSEKMSKSKNNLVDPDELMEAYGADTLRLFSLFAAPPEKDLPWSDEGIAGARRFLERLWRVANRVAGEEPGEARRDDEQVEALRRKAHRTVARVTEDIGRRIHLNTAIAAVMELVNALYEYAPVEEDLPRPVEPLREAVELAVRILNPFAPHVTEELWERLGGEGRLADAPWPAWDEELARREEITLVVQINGKVRGRVQVAADATEEELAAAAREAEGIPEHLEKGTLRKTITVPGRLVNFVVSP